MTTFHFADGQDLSRWLLKKEYADATSVTYTRSPDGKLETRTWARLDGANPLVTTYDYYDDAGTDSALTGELQKVDYSDATKDVEYTAYTRLGQPKTVVDIVGTRTFAYNAYPAFLTKGTNPVLAWPDRGVTAGFRRRSVPCCAQEPRHACREDGRGAFLRALRRFGADRFRVGFRLVHYSGFKRVS